MSSSTRSALQTYSAKHCAARSLRTLAQMSRRLANLFPAHRVRATPCRRVPAALRPQLRPFSDVQPVHDSVQPPIARSRAQDFAGEASPREQPGSSPEEMAQHLNSQFPPLKFPPELAARVLTHASHPDAVLRHNARMSFIGRRVLQSYLLLFMHASPALQDAHDLDLLCERALNTYVLGEHVAPRWALGSVLNWTPVHTGPLAKSLARGERAADVLARMGSDGLHSVGLYKIHGTAVEAVVGAVFHQYGGAVAHRFFHTRVLPHVLLPGTPHGLHDAFHEHALEICERLGGADGALVAERGGTAAEML
ncbi:ribonuclease-III-like-domain-containing protein [Amylocystis lapponica]|nr:ribonuclease-III-like-domain-containing protein [Amylocystis lapponica]